MNNIKTLLAIGVITMAVFACKKNDADFLIIPPAAAHFTNQTLGTYYIQNSATSVYNVPVGVTTVSNKDRVVNYTVSSSTGAASGTQFSIANSGSVTIPAGQAVAYIPVKGIYSGYPTTARVDTLTFKLAGADVDTAPYNNEFKLVLKKYCDVNLNAFLGDYNNSFNNTAPATKYKVTVTSITSTGPTSGYMMITGLFTPTASAVRVNLDWSDPANFKTTLVSTPGIYNDATYGAVTVNPVGNGTFSSCDNTFTISYQRQVSVGVFAANTTTLVR